MKDLIRSHAGNQLPALRASLRALQAEHFFLGRPLARRGDDKLDLTWLGPDGEALTADRWNDSCLRSLQMIRRTADPDDRAVLLALNGSLEPVPLTLPSDEAWELVWDSTWENPVERLSLDDEDDPELEPLSIRMYVSKAP